MPVKRRVRPLPSNAPPADGSAGSMAAFVPAEVDVVAAADDGNACKSQATEPLQVDATGTKLEAQGSLLLRQLQLHSFIKQKQVKDRKLKYQCWIQ